MFQNNFPNTYTTYVTKRNGDKEEVSFDKVIRRIKFLSSGLDVNTINVSQQIISQIVDGILTSDLDLLGADICINLTTVHPDYGKLASRILISNHHKNTTPSFSECIEILHKNTDKRGDPAPLINDEVYQLVMENKNKINDVIDHNRDNRIDYFGFKTLERSYLLRSKTKIIERPQYLWMRVALGIHRNDFKDAIETYDLMSQGYFTHATPTLFNASTCKEQLSSCFLLTMKDDSVEGIYDTLKQCALISQTAGGIGLSVHNIRSLGSYIKGTGGTSNGLIPMLKVYNNTAKYIDQCFMPDTYVYTLSGPKKFNQLHESIDAITNINGEFEVIDKILEHHYKGDVCKIYTKYSLEPTVVTEKHPIYCLKGQKKGTNHNVISNRLEKGLIELDWIEAGELTTDDMIAFTIPTYYKDYDHISEDDCYLYGLMIGYGSIATKDNMEYRLHGHIKNKEPYMDFVRAHLNSKLIEFHDIDKGNNCIMIRWRGTANNLPFSYSDLYDENHGKRISPRFMNLPNNKILQIIKGLIHSDGCIHKEITLEMTSRQVIESVRYMCLRLGILTSGYVRHRIGETHKSGDKVFTTRQMTYVIRFPKVKILMDTLNLPTVKWQNYFTYKNMLFTRIEGIEHDKYEGLMYDLEMKNEHNYTTHLGLAHNGGGKRCGSFAIYLEPHHPDIKQFLDAKKNTGTEDDKARDLFYALWISDEFMRRVDKDEKWTLLDPNEFPGLHDVYGEDYTNLYNEYEKIFNLRYKYDPQELKMKVIKARDIWKKMIESQVETGSPYIGFKDAVNTKNNQSNLGTIRSSNLCNEINLYTSKDEVAVCNLASICLPRFVDTETLTFDFEKLKHVVKIVVKNLNKVIDVNYYPVPEAKNSNLKHRPIGCGIQGLADTFCLLRMPFDSPEAKKLNQQIAEHMYLAGVEASIEIAKKRAGMIEEFMELVEDTYDDWRDMIVNEGSQYVYNIPVIHYLLNFDSLLFKYKQTINEWQTAEQLAKSIGAENSGLNDFDDKKEILKKMKILFDLQKILKLIPEELNRNNYYGAYSSFIGSPLHHGKLHYDLWNHTPSDELIEQFTAVKAEIQRYGLRNSTLFAYMPTASTSQIQGNNECFEPYTYNIYTRKVLSGQHKVINKHLIKDLLELGLWSNDMKDLIIAHGGSVQNIPQIPDNIKALYKNVWEISQKILIDYAADRGPYICMTQSMNLFVSDPTYAKMTSMLFYSWKKGLKSGIYYLRTRTKANAQQFTIDPKLLERVNNINKKNNISPAPIEGFVCSRDNPDCEACGS